MPTGAVPTGVVDRRALAGSVRSRRVLKDRTLSSARAVTHATRPSLDRTTRTGEHPAYTLASTEWAGSRSALRRSITLSVPSGPGVVPVPTPVGMLHAAGL